MKDIKAKDDRCHLALEMLKNGVCIWTVNCMRT